MIFMTDDPRPNPNRAFSRAIVSLTNCQRCPAPFAANSCSSWKGIPRFFSASTYETPGISREDAIPASLHQFLNILGGLFFKCGIRLAFYALQSGWRDYKIIEENRCWCIQFRYVIRGSRLPKLPKIGSRTTGWLCELGIVEYESSHFAKIRLTRRRPWGSSLKIQCLRNRECLYPINDYQLGN